MPQAVRQCTIRKTSSHNLVVRDTDFTLHKTSVFLYWKFPKIKIPQLVRIPSKKPVTCTQMNWLFSKQMQSGKTLDYAALTELCSQQEGGMQWAGFPWLHPPRLLWPKLTLCKCWMAQPFHSCSESARTQNKSAFSKDSQKIDYRQPDLLNSCPEPCGYGKPRVKKWEDTCLIQ